MAPRARLAAALMFSALLSLVGRALARAPSGGAKRSCRRSAASGAPRSASRPARPDLWGRGKDLANPGFVGERCHWLDGGFPRCERCAGGGGVRGASRRGRCPKFRRATNGATSADVSRDPPALRLTWADADVAHSRSVPRRLRAPCFNVSRCGLAADAPVRVYAPRLAQRVWRAARAARRRGRASERRNARGSVRPTSARACSSRARARSRARPMSAPARPRRGGAHHLLWQPNEWDRDVTGAPPTARSAPASTPLAMLAQAVRVRASFRQRRPHARASAAAHRRARQAPHQRAAARPRAAAAAATASDGGAPRSTCSPSAGRCSTCRTTGGSTGGSRPRTGTIPRAASSSTLCSRGRATPANTSSARPTRARGRAGRQRSRGARVRAVTAPT